MTLGAPPTSAPAPLAAMAESPDAQLGRELAARIPSNPGESPAVALHRIVLERDAAQEKAQKAEAACQRLALAAKRKLTKKAGVKRRR